MSRYATPADLQRIALPARALTDISTDDQQSALDVASATADSYLSSRLRLPLISWGDDLRRAVCHVAAYDLMCRRGYNPQGGGDPNIRLRNEDALAWLREVSLGHVAPAVIETQDTPPSAPSVSRVLSYPKRGW